MAISLDARAVSVAAAADPRSSGNFTVASGSSWLGVKCAWENAETITEVRWGGSGGAVMSLVTGSEQTSSGNRKTAIYQLVNPTAQTSTIWVDLSASFIFAFELVSLFGVDTADPIDDVDGNTASSATAIACASALVASASGRWMESIGSGGNPALTHTPQGSATETADADSGGGAFRIFGSFQAGIDTSVTPGFDVDTDSHTMALSAVLLNPATSPASLAITEVFNGDGGSGVPITSVYVGDGAGGKLVWEPSA